MDLAREVDKEELKLKRVQTEMGWMKKHAEEMDIVIDGYNDEWLVFCFFLILILLW